MGVTLRRSRGDWSILRLFLIQCRSFECLSGLLCKGRTSESEGVGLPISHMDTIEPAIDAAVQELENIDDEEGDEVSLRSPSEGEDIRSGTATPTLVKKKKRIGWQETTVEEDQTTDMAQRKPATVSSSTSSSFSSPTTTTTTTPSSLKTPVRESEYEETDTDDREGRGGGRAAKTGLKVTTKTGGRPVSVEGRSGVVDRKGQQKTGVGAAMRAASPVTGSEGAEVEDEEEAEDEQEEEKTTTTTTGAGQKREKKKPSASTKGLKRKPTASVEKVEVGGAGGGGGGEVSGVVGGGKKKEGAAAGGGGGGAAGGRGGEVAEEEEKDVADSAGGGRWVYRHSEWRRSSLGKS